MEEEEKTAPADEAQDESQRTRLLQEVDDLLAQSYLIFLYSDLRLLSATGRVNIKFETLAIDSDQVSKTDAASLAVLPNEIRDIVRNSGSQNEGISPAQIMGALMVELRKEAKAHRRKSSRSGEEDEHGELSHPLLDPKRRKEYEEDMDSLLKAYNYMIGTDMRALEELPEVKGQTSDYTKFLNKPMEAFQKGGEEGDNKKAPAQQRARRRQSLVTPNPVNRCRLSVITSNTPIPNFGSNQVEELGDAIFNMSTKGGDESLERNLTEDEVLDLMEDAVVSREYGRLNFMKDFFREDSVSAVMVQSDARIVWMNDWYPLKDLTYAVSVNKSKKEVLLVFRGAITKADWAHATNWELKDVDNPIDENYENKTDKILMHAGFYRYLFRIRKDTGTRKYDEIKTVVHEYGSKLIGDYRLVVTGHSLGAALSTIFGLFASADERFTARGPINMYTFGSPYVGGKTFLEAFRHQEYSRKIQYVRFHNVRDGVTHMPIGWKGKFQHVGISVKLHRVPKGCNRWRGQLAPEASYYKKSDSWSLYWKAFRENWFFNMPFPWNTAKCHTLHELRKRLMPAIAMLDKTRMEMTLDDLCERLIYDEDKKAESGNDNQE